MYGLCRNDAAGWLILVSNGGSLPAPLSPIGMLQLHRLLGYMRYSQKTFYQPVQVSCALGDPLQIGRKFGRNLVSLVLQHPSGKSPDMADRRT